MGDDGSVDELLKELAEGNFNDFVGDDKANSNAGVSTEDTPKQRRYKAGTTEHHKRDPLSRKIIIIPDEERVTTNVLQRAEAARLISIRAKQISEYSTNYLVNPQKGQLYDPQEIAKRELFERRIPLLLRRHVGRTPDGDIIVEQWNPREMTLPQL